MRSVPEKTAFGNFSFQVRVICWRNTNCTLSCIFAVTKPFVARHSCTANIRAIFHRVMKSRKWLISFRNCHYLTGNGFDKWLILLDVVYVGG